MTAPCRLSLALLFVLLPATTGIVTARQSLVGTRADRRLIMHDHFSQVDVVQTAVIRGDLESVWEPARWLSKQTPSIPATPATQPYLDRVIQAASKAAEASTMHDAAQAAAALSALCGGCHKAAGAQVALPAERTVMIGGIVGHMQEHQIAMSDLQIGLVEPSETSWMRGARRMQTAPMKRSKFPSDRLLSEAILAVEVQVHQLANQAMSASSLEERAAVFGQLLAGCAECHGLHGRIWGPGLPEQ